jgi:hypothetical protein
MEAGAGVGSWLSIVAAAALSPKLLLSLGATLSECPRPNDGLGYAEQRRDTARGWFLEPER